MCVPNYAEVQHSANLNHGVERRSKKIGLGESKWILTESGAVALAILLQDATQAEGDSGVDFPQKNAEEEFKTIKVCNS